MIRCWSLEPNSLVPLLANWIASGCVCRQYKRTIAQDCVMTHFSCIQCIVCPWDFDPYFPTIRSSDRELLLNTYAFVEFIDICVFELCGHSVRRRGKNRRLVVEVESLASSWKIYDASTWSRRRRRRKKWRKSTNFQQKFVWFTYRNNAHKNSVCVIQNK